MSDEKVLTKEIAEQYSENEYSVFLDEYTCIEDDAAEILGRLKSESLCLASITSLSDAAAGHLSKFQGESIDLMELSNLPDSVASHLCDFQGEINLNGLRHISKQLSSILSTFSSSKIELHSLETISDEAASCLENYKGVLSLRANQLSENAASHLIKCNGPLLIDLAELPDAVQAILLRKESVAEMYGLDSRNVGAILLDGIEEAVESASLYFSSDKKSDILGPTLSRFVVRGTGKSCFQLACFADGLRVVVKATRAEHELSDEEIGDKLNDADAFIQKAVDIFAKYCRNYSRFEERKQHSLIDFIRFYIADSGPFGLSAQATAWSSIKTCEQLVNLFEDDSALEVLRITFVDAAKKYLDEDEISNIEFLGELAVDIERHESDEMYDSALATDNGDVLTKEIAEQYLEGVVESTMTFTSIDDEAASTLAEKVKCEDSLHLDGIQELSDIAANNLSRFSGEIILTGLVDFPDTHGHLALAGTLAKQNVLFGVSLSCLTSLSAKLALQLGKGTAGLDLSGVEELSADAAGGLSSHDGDIDLSGLETITDSVAASLGKHKGDLDLSGLETVSDSAAASLGKHAGTLRLPALSSLTETQAEGLSKHQGDLILWGIQSLTEAAAAHLSKHQGKLSFDELEELSDAASIHLAKHGNLELTLYELSDFAKRTLFNAGYKKGLSVGELAMFENADKA